MHDFPLLNTIAVGFAAAWVLGIITHHIGLSPIVGYLLAGVAIGRHTPGFQGDIDSAKQLSEIGVILLMFGVGLHFHLKDLLKVKGIAIPGAIAQSGVTMLVTLAIFHQFGFDWKTSLMVGMALSVASTVVLLRVLMDRDMLSTAHGHVAVGWLIVEDVFTVLALVLVPLFGQASDAAATAPNESHAGATSGWVSILWAMAKLGALVAIVLLAGSRVMPWVMVQVAKIRSRELFTLTVLVVSITVAVMSAMVFGASVALGAFLAGMVVGQSAVSQQAASDVLPLRDAFAVLFFVSVGMLFDPTLLVREPALVAATLAIVLLVKPIVAVIVVAVLGYSSRTALTVAIGLAQVGEFSFILAEVARQHGVMTEQGQGVVIAAAILSISLNPLWFSSLDRIEAWIEARPRLWRLLNSRAERRLTKTNLDATSAIAETTKPLAVIVGYGPVGRVVDALLRDSGMETVIVDMNMDTVSSLTESGRLAVFGDATRADILEQAGVDRAVHLIITLPHSSSRAAMVLAAKEANPLLEVTVRAKYLGEREDLDQAGAATVIYEEGEAGIAMARHVMVRRGVSADTVEKMLDALRRLWGIREVNGN